MGPRGEPLPPKAQNADIVAGLRRNRELEGSGVLVSFRLMLEMILFEITFRKSLIPGPSPDSESNRRHRESLPVVDGPTGISLHRLYAPKVVLKSNSSTNLKYFRLRRD